MARSRSQLHEMLQEVQEDLPVYFQPPTTGMDYPCIKYERDRSYSEHADNVLYYLMKRYQVTVIDRDPDSGIPDLVEALPYTRMDRFFVREGLNHWVFSLYF